MKVDCEICPIKNECVAYGYKQKEWCPLVALANKQMKNWINQVLRRENR